VVSKPSRCHNGGSPKHRSLEERRLPACNRRQLADDVVFGKLPNTADKLPALPNPRKTLLAFVPESSSFAE
jgi:hypothetical protein